MAKQIENQHEVKIARRIADVRPWSDKVQEKLSEPSNFLLFIAPILIVTFMVPMILPITFLLFIAGHLAVLKMKNHLPYRYPAHKGIDPRSGKPADGILLVGAVRSESPFEKFKQCWLSDSDLRKHWLIMGSTGSGKSETLKGIFYNALCWGSGFFCADGKADNKLPTDGYTMARAFARDDDVLYLNFLLGGKTPQQVARARRRRSNRLNPFSSGDADTLVQMGANLLPKAEGDGKSWQEKALAVWRAVITALCYKRDMHGITLSVGAIIDYLSLSKIEELYVEGYKECSQSSDKSWSYGYAGIKNYLDSGCPAYSVEKLLKKHNLVDSAPPQMPGIPPGRRPAPGRETEQDPAALEQHGYRVGQLMPVLNLLDKTYGHIFRAAFPEIDMIDVALHNRILFLLIPSLEKSSQEAENLGKLAIACLRVMMARNLGAELEGTREELLDSKATEAPYPYIVALDELGYYFADGIAVMFAQARALGISMMAAAQDLEKLTEGSRKAEAGAMIGNTVNKIFMKIDDPETTYKLVSATVGKVQVATFAGYEAGNAAGGFKRNVNLQVQESDMIPYQEMQKYTEGQGVMNALGVTQRISTFYMGDWLKKLNNTAFYVNRFLQVNDPTDEDIEKYSIDPLPGISTATNTRVPRLMTQLRLGEPLPPARMAPVFAEMIRVTQVLNSQASGMDPVERGVTIYLALKEFALSGKATVVPPATPAVHVPQLAALLGSEQEAVGLAQALDEHGLPDPLSLLRKPLGEILGAVDEHPIRHPLSSSAMAAAQPGVGDSALSIADPLSGLTGMSAEETFGRGDLPGATTGIAIDDHNFGFASAPAENVDPISEMLERGRPESRPGDPAAWVSQAVADADKMRDTPRSANNTAVGLSDETMGELEHLEAELGSSTPRTSAQIMQKVVSSQITPDTVGRGTVSEEEIDKFFERLTDDEGGTHD